MAIAKDRPDNILESSRFETGTPQETFAKIKVTDHNTTTITRQTMMRCCWYW